MTESSIDSRSLQLAQLSGLSDREWFSQISNFYPEVVSPEGLEEDLQRLDQLSQVLVRQDRYRRIRNVATIGLGSALVAGVVMFNSDIIDLNTRVSEIPSAVFPLAFALTTGLGFFVLIADQSTRISNTVRGWNARGQIWAQQQRERLSGINR